MKKSIILTLMCFTLFFTGEVFAQCNVNLINYRDVLEKFSGTYCKEAMDACYVKISELQSDPNDPDAQEKYTFAYCDVGPAKTVKKTYDRCQAKDTMRCTIEWSDRTVDAYDVDCDGCIERSNPSPAPLSCKSNCPFLTD